MKIKGYLLMVVCLSVLLLSSCSSKVEVNSAREALRLLLQVNTTISEHIVYLEDDTDNKDLTRIEKSLEETLRIIAATEDYCVDEDVNKRYESAMKSYEKCEKLLKNLKG